MWGLRREEEFLEMTGEMHIHSTKKLCETVAETKQQKKCFCQKKLDGTSVRFRM